MKNKKYISFAIILLLAFLCIACNAYAYTFDDPVNDVWHWPGDPDDFDRIGRPIFELFGVDVIHNSSNTIFDIYTNFPNDIYSVGSWDTFPSDLAMDLNGDGVYEYGIAFTGHDGLTAGTLYNVTDWYISDDYDPGDRTYIYHHNRIVTIENGTSISSNVLNWYVNDPGSDPSVPNWRINLVLNNSDFLPPGFIGNLDFFFGGATCANDFIGGSLIIPEPVSILLFGTGLLGFRIFKRREVK